MKIRILYEDVHILAVDKPSGLAVHPDGKTKEKTLVDWVLKNYPKIKGVGEALGDIERPGIVHRLDRETSGVLLLAKDQKTHEFLKSQFQNREIKKVYHAIVSGSVRSDRGVINKPIGRSPRDFRRYLSGRGARGELRDAITEYRVLKRLKGFTYLEVRPKTGRTHQIRVHMKYINHPVAGDLLYNPEEKKWDRMMLHAFSIEFKNMKGEAVKIESPLPKEFGKVLNSK